VGVAGVDGFLSLPILQILQSRAMSAGLLGNEDDGAQIEIGGKLCQGNTWHSPTFHLVQVRSALNKVEGVVG
jgi:PPE-repeat protein